MIDKIKWKHATVILILIFAALCFSHYLLKHNQHLQAYKQQPTELDRTITIA